MYNFKIECSSNRVFRRSDRMSHNERYNKLYYKVNSPLYLDDYFVMDDMILEIQSRGGKAKLD